MRLVRIAIGNVNTTVGAVRATSTARIALARAAGGRRRDASCVFPSSSSAATRPKTSCSGAASSTRSGSELERFAKETARPRRCSSRSALTVARGAQRLQLRGARPRRARSSGSCRRRSCPPTTSSTKRARFARGAPGLVDERRTACRSATSSSTSTSARVALEVCEDIWSPDGPMRRRCYAGAELVVNLSRVALPPRRRRDAARDDRHARRRQPVHRRLRQPRRRQRRPRLRRRRLRRAERPHRARGAALPRGLRRGDGRSRSHAAPPHREHHLARRPGDVRRAGADASRTSTSTRADRRRATQLALPGAAAPELLLARAASAERTPRARRSAKTCSTRSRSGVGDYFEKTGAFKTIGVALSGGRDSLLVPRHRAPLDRPPLRRPRRGAKRRRARSCARSSCRRATRRRRRAPPPSRPRKDLDAPFAVVPIDDAFERELAAVEKMLQPGETLDADGAAERAGAHARRAHVDLGQQRGGLFLQTSNMSEKAVGYTTIGGDMEGALSVIANVPKTVVNYLLDYLLETTKLRGHPPDAEEAGVGRSSPTIRRTRRISCRSRCSTRASRSTPARRWRPTR